MPWDTNTVHILFKNSLQSKLLTLASKKNALLLVVINLLTNDGGGHYKRCSLYGADLNIRYAQIHTAPPTVTDCCLNFDCCLCKVEGDG